MPEQPIFSINESETKKQNHLCVNLLTSKSLLPRELKQINFEKIPFSKSVEILKLLAAHGSIIFREKRLVLDFFGKTDFQFHVSKDSQGILILSGKIKIRDQEFGLDETDLLIPGNPIWFIKGYNLKMLPQEASWTDLKCLPQKLTADELERFSREISSESSLKVVIEEGLHVKAGDPTPFLILTDRTGAFANLWMDYGNDKKIPFNELHSSEFKRNMSCEMGWERDLLETDFIRKQAGTSSYYCPLDKVGKSIAFLLEMGWNVLDCKGRRVIKESGASICADIDNGKIIVSGKVEFDNFEFDLAHIAGAFNRKDRFLNLSENSVGLLETGSELASLAQEGELSSSGITLSRFQLGSVLDCKEVVQLSPSLSALKDGLITPFKKGPGNLKGFCGTLRPYQETGVDWLSTLYTNCLSGALADDMGLGKTVQVLAFLSTLEPSKRHLIVVPTSLIFNWRTEIQRFIPDLSLYVHHGAKRVSKIEDFPGSGIILTSYALLRIEALTFSKLPVECLIADEAQTIKNQETMAAQALRSIPSRWRLSITGTLVENSLHELFSHFHFLMPGLLGDFAAFSQELLCASSDSRYLKRIQKKVKPFILRRKKEEVAQDLPPKIEQTVYIEMDPSQRVIYDSFLSSFKKNLLTKVTLEGIAKHRIAIFEALLRLRQICCHPLLFSQSEEELKSSKMELLLKEAEAISTAGGKALIFSQFSTMLSLIGRELSLRNISFCYLDGSTKDREREVKRFQESQDVPLFLISLKAGGTGLNLTAADTVFIYDPWWNDAVENQAINRAHRIGREKTVHAKRYIAVDSIEEKMVKLKEAKNALIQGLFSCELARFNLSEEDLLFLLE